MKCVVRTKRSCVGTGLCSRAGRKSIAGSWVVVCEPEPRSRAAKAKSEARETKHGADLNQPPQAFQQQTDPEPAIDYMWSCRTADRMPGGCPLPPHQEYDDDGNVVDTGEPFLSKAGKNGVLRARADARKHNEPSFQAFGGTRPSKFGRPASDVCAVAPKSLRAFAGRIGRRRAPQTRLNEHDAQSSL